MVRIKGDEIEDWDGLFPKSESVGHAGADPHWQSAKQPMGVSQGEVPHRTSERLP